MVALKEKEFAKKIHIGGGKAYKVGGAVRDFLRGYKPKDNDYVLVGVSRETFMKTFPQAENVGKSFPVFLLEIEGEVCEVAFARKEKKVGVGYKGFDVFSDESVTLEEDLIRRDTTMNAIAQDLFSGEIIDLFGGKDDIEKGIIRAVSDAFIEDPVRSLRVARQSAQFGFSVSDDTIEKMRMTKEELKAEPTERFVEEFKKALATEKPSVFFDVLRRAELLDVTFPTIHAMIDVPQPVQWHPEGDVYNHTMITLDRVASATDNLVTRFAAIAHDLGKTVTPADILPKHIGHDFKGVDVLLEWNKFMVMPVDFIKAGTFTILNHMRFHTIKNPLKFVDLVTKADRNVIGVQQFTIVTDADHGEKDKNSVAAVEAIKIINDLKIDIPPTLKGENIGFHIREKRAKAIAHLLK